MDYFSLNFQLMQHHNYNLYDIENMVPWERDIYVEQLRQYIEEQNLKNLQSTLTSHTKR
jgi:hypothetical protein